MVETNGIKYVRLQNERDKLQTNLDFLMELVREQQAKLRKHDKKLNAHLDLMAKEQGNG